jgi:hypothetical protein
LTLYLETSALLRAALLAQPEVIARMDAVEHWSTSTLTLVECERTLVAMAHGKRLTRGARSRAHAWLREVVWRTDVSELDAAMFDRAGQAFPVEPVRTLDGLHLAAILRWAELGPVEVLTCDLRVKQNAEALGLTVSFFPDQPTGF